ncbi:MAG: methionine--tRNA ligase [Victivallales bacterium]|nr:methionine--tRNA ligase [Victivallales bacterium]
MAKKKLITSALPYVNNEPHLGNIIGCVLSADVFARYCRLKGYETLYICGNDEYGTATETKAHQEGLSPGEICDKYHEIHKKIYSHFNISFDAFGRTATEEQKEIVQDIFKKILKNGYFLEKETDQYYSKSQGKFLADRLISGTCPKCGYDDARGDQCDGCGSLLDPIDLINPKSVADGKPLILKKTKNLYLNLPKLTPLLKIFQEKEMIEGFWTNNAVTTTHSWMKRGLEPRAITRDLKWGIPVPKEGYEDKVFYVWFDAPIGYVSITKKAFPNNWKDWWKTPRETELYQFMAKDNIPFHSVIFPATQIATKEDWTKVYHLNSTEYLNYEDTKFSKSRNVGVFGTDVIKSDIPSDLWRFYLLINRPEKNDSAFIWQEFFDKVNNEFIDNIGNLVNRSLVYCCKNFEGKLRKVPYTTQQQEFIDKTINAEVKITESFENVSLRDTLRQILLLGKTGNKFFQDQAPWVKIKEDKDEVQGTVNILVHLIKDLSIMLHPYMPETSEKIQKMLNFKKLSWDSIGNFTELLDTKTAKPEILYRKLDEKLVEKYKNKYDGTIKEDPWSRIELKVGKVLEVKPHPTASHLYIEKIDIGEKAPRRIVSGLVKHFRLEEVLGKKVLIVSNLQTAELSGVKSEGMLLCAAKKKKMEIVSTEDMNIGSIAYREHEVPTPKNKTITIDEFKSAGLRTKNGKIQCDDENILIEGKQLTTKKLMNSKIS